MYEPTTGRFSTLDPFFGNLNDPQSLHKYMYVHGDPVNNIDPTGLYSSPAVGSVYAMFVSATLGAPPGGQRIITEGRPVRTDGGFHRQLTMKEKKILEYFYKSAFPGLRENNDVGEKLRVDLSAIMSKVKLWEFDSVEGWHKLGPSYLTARLGIEGGGAGAVSVGDDQYYKVLPKADNVDDLPLVAHELFHSYHAELMGLGAHAFVTYYVTDGALTAPQVGLESLFGFGWIRGDTYHNITTEMYGHAVQDVFMEMIKDPVFVSAFQNETEANLPESMRTKIEIKILENLRIRRGY